MGDLDQHASAVAGGFICSDRTAVQQVQEDLLAVSEDFVVPAAGDIYNGTYAASIMFVLRVIQPESLRRTTMTNS